jgi:hypothetical protein
MDQLITKFDNLGIEEVKRPTLPKGKRTAYALFMKQQSIDMKSKGEAFQSLGFFNKNCSKKWKVCPKS